ncbi:MAG: hypothetical protein RJA99_3833 [Pseudomonadota bacterium]|jgi:hypothetical protein
MSVSPVGAVSAAPALTPAAPVAGTAPALPSASSGQISGFEAALARAGGPSGAPASDSSMLRSMMKPLDQMDDRAASIASKAAQFVSGTEMTPGDMIMMTVRCQEFMFQCQLTSNVANRTSDGLQQLFRQQG